MLIKKTLFAFCLALLFVILLQFNKEVGADETPSVSVEVTAAQIRLTDPQGLRFVAKVTGELDDVKSFGIAIAFGVCDASDIEVGGTVNNKAVLSKTVDETTVVAGENVFYITLINIPEDSYGQNVTARGFYVKQDESIVYDNNAVTRSIAFVAAHVYQDNQGIDFINEAIDKLHNQGYVSVLASVSSYKVVKIGSTYDPDTFVMVAKVGDQLFEPSIESTKMFMGWYTSSTQLVAENCIQTVPALTNGEEAVEIFPYVVDIQFGNYLLFMSKHNEILTKTDLTLTGSDEEKNLLDDLVKDYEGNETAFEEYNENLDVHINNLIVTHEVIKFKTNNPIASKNENSFDNCTLTELNKAKEDIISAISDFESLSDNAKGHFTSEYNDHLEKLSLVIEVKIFTKTYTEIYAVANYNALEQGNDYVQDKVNTLDDLEALRDLANSAKNAYSNLDQDVKDELVGVSGQDDFETHVDELIFALEVRKFYLTYKDVFEMTTANVIVSDYGRIIQVQSAYDSLDQAVKTALDDNDSETPTFDQHISMLFLGITAKEYIQVYKAVFELETATEADYDNIDAAIVAYDALALISYANLSGYTAQSVLDDMIPEIRTSLQSLLGSGDFSDEKADFLSVFSTKVGTLNGENVVFSDYENIVDTYKEYSKLKSVTKTELADYFAHISALLNHILSVEYTAGYVVDATKYQSMLTIFEDYATFFQSDIRSVIAGVFPHMVNLAYAFAANNSEDTVYVQTEAQLRDALAREFITEINLLNDITGTAVVGYAGSSNRSLVIDGKNFTINFGVELQNGSDITIKNINFVIENKELIEFSSNYYVIGIMNGSKVELDGVNITVFDLGFDNPVYGVHITALSSVAKVTNCNIVNYSTNSDSYAVWSSNQDAEISNTFLKGYYALGLGDFDVTTTSNLSNLSFESVSFDILVVTNKTGILNHATVSEDLSEVDLNTTYFVNGFIDFVKSFDEVSINYYGANGAERAKLTYTANPENAVFTLYQTNK